MQTKNAVNIEITPDDDSANLFLMVHNKKLPRFDKKNGNTHYIMVRDMPFVTGTGEALTDTDRRVFNRVKVRFLLAALGNSYTVLLLVS